ncbi:MAG: response regulator transcription factor [Chloroflexota bacterium]|nr:response regulator transcription factor [Chloroflexota bacterium]
MIKTLVVDDQALVRGGLCAMLEAKDDIDVVGEAADGIEAVEQSRLRRPDVVLMDIRMPRMDGIEATRRLMAGAQAPKVLILTTFDIDEYVYEAMRAGAAGFLLKDTPPSTLAEGIRTVTAGEALLAPSVTRRLVEHFVRRPPSTATVTATFSELTSRELEILRHVAGGLSNREIASKLFLSEATVKTHVTRILAKLGLRGRVQAVVLAYETGLVEPRG